MSKRASRRRRRPYVHATRPESALPGYEAEENECVAELLHGLPDKGSHAPKAIFEEIVRRAFQAGLQARARDAARLPIPKIVQLPASS